LTCGRHANLIRSGKTSILKVIFQRMGPQYTMMLDPTLKIETIQKTFGSYFTINIYDFPGKYDFKDLSPTEIGQLSKCGAMIYVIDVQVNIFNSNHLSN
jgi:Ras-related GTP-binding protein C/D